MKPPFFAVLLVGILSLLACSVPEKPPGPPLRSGASAFVAVVIPEASEPLLEIAANDLAQSIASIAQVAKDEVHHSLAGLEARARVEVRLIDADEYGDEGFRIETESLNGQESLVVKAKTHTGAAYGLYEIIYDLGVRYLHPEESFVPQNPSAHLPYLYDGSLDLPRFSSRGFHEHTQHPIPESEYLLKASESGRALASHYLLWLARNRQNTMSFQMLRTVDLQTFLPHIASIIAEAHTLSIDVGLVLGFVDEQQNSFKLLVPNQRPARTEQEQIEQGLDPILDAGFDFVTLQVGASEFTKPADAHLLSWLQTTADFVAREHPNVKLHSWIHTTCDLDAEDGSLYFHLPGRGPASIGAWVHTTMFYDLENPAPVYGCENFHQQRDFITSQEGQRELTYFPESAWWLGFDNTVPFALPITGYSRAHDIQSVLKDRQVTGHMTFSTGREWTYWQYDHYLTRVTWDSSLSWEKYLEELAPIYGSAGPAIRQATMAMTEEQRRDFYERDPDLYFYIAGELPQDEIGEQAGILARRPKPSYRSIVDASDQDYAAWESLDFQSLGEMSREYRRLISNLPEDHASGTAQQAALYREAHHALVLFALRVEHAYTLYDAVRSIRRGRVLLAAGSVDQAALREAQASAEEKLEAARAITEQAQNLIRAVEPSYRYAPSLLTEALPESLTVYPFGYLYDTKRAYFWTRRDEQLEAMIATVFHAEGQAWESPNPLLVFRAARDEFQVSVPSDSLGAAALRGFMPNLLFATNTVARAEGELALRLAQDGDENGLPDANTTVSLAGTIAGNNFVGTTPSLEIRILDQVGAVLSTISLVNVRIALTLREGASLDFASGTLAGNLVSSDIVQTIGLVTGTSPDASRSLIKQVYGYPADQELPIQLPLELRFTPTLLSL